MFLINTKLVVDGKGNKNIFTKNISIKKINFLFFYKCICEYIKEYVDNPKIYCKQQIDEKSVYLQSVLSQYRASNHAPYYIDYNIVK